jgi:excisionase family DNA binding protein
VEEVQIPPERLWAKAAAAYLGVTEGTLAVWRSDKRYRIPFLKVGGRVQYRKGDLDAWLASRVVGAPGAAG